MDDLVQFLRARLDEDERAAKAVVWDRSGNSLSWELSASATVEVGGDSFYAGDRTVANHIARHDPARVLREIEAKRQLVHEFEQAGSVPDTPERRASSHWQGDFGYLQGLARAVHLLALPYSDHPDYREDWRP